MTRAEYNLEFVTELFQAGEVYERFNEIDDVDFEETSEDLCRIAFNDGSAILINPGDKTVEVL